MKKIFYALWIIISIFSLMMCSKTSELDEERTLLESVLENEKSNIDPEKLEAELVQLVNDHRTSIGKSQLFVSEESYIHAKEHTDYMISKGVLSHDNFEDRASKIASEIDAVEVGENVARYYSSASLALEGWLDSSSHKNTLEGDFTHTVLSVELDKDGRAYFTQVFMRVEASNQ